LGEDGIIEKILEIMSPLEKWCVEVGAGDGFTLSNTYNLITAMGWSSVQIEADPEKFAVLQKRYSDNPRIYRLNRTIDFEGSNAMDQLLGLTPIPTNFDLLSLDIDGNDYHVWDSMKKYRPRIVIVEFNPTIPNHIQFVQARDMRVHQGASLRALTNLAKEKGYELVCATDWNGFYVDREHYDLFDIPNNSVEEIHKDNKYLTDIFQLFDGTVVLDGCKKLLWHGIEIDEEQIQPLPKQKRVFPGG
jgi:hypothetical protein